MATTDILVVDLRVTGLSSFSPVFPGMEARGL
jgi:hypothetical protein